MGKNFLTVSPIYLAGDTSIMFLAYLRDEVAVAVNSFLSIVIDTFWGFSVGFLVIARSAINNRIGQGNAAAARSTYEFYELTGLIIGSLAAVGQLLLQFLAVHYKIYNGEEFRDVLSSCYFFYSIYWVFGFNNQFYDSVLRSLNLHWMFMPTSVLYFCESLVIYLFAVYFGYGVLAVGVALTWSGLVKALAVRSVINWVDWEEIEEIED